MNANNPTASRGSSATRKILILWAIIFAATLFGILVCLRPLTDFILMNSPHNYAPFARQHLENGEPQKAVDHLVSVMRFLPPEDAQEAYHLLAEAYGELGDEARGDLWTARAEFEKSWLMVTPHSIPALADRWDRPSALAASAAERLGAGVDTVPDQWLKRMAEKMFFAKAKAGAPIEEWIADRTARQNLGLLLAGGAELVIADRGIMIPGIVLLQSAGFEQGKGALAVFEGEALINAAGPGYHMVALNPSSGEYSPPRDFNTYANRSASERMIEYLQGIPNGWQVLVAASDEAAKMADSVLVERAFAMVGVEFPKFRFKTRAPSYREPFVGLGTKGGKGVCVLGDRWGRPAALIALPMHNGRKAVTSSPPD